MIGCKQRVREPVALLEPRSVSPLGFPATCLSARVLAYVGQGARVLRLCWACALAFASSMRLLLGL